MFLPAAYLLQNNFKASAKAFLQECDVLPSKTFLVRLTMQFTVQCSYGYWKDCWQDWCDCLPCHY